MSTTAPLLPDGFVVIVKHECATCQMVEPVLAAIAASGAPLTVYTQDNPDFPASVPHTLDSTLAVSWHNDIETVPTLLVIKDGVEIERTFGWSQAEWQRITGIASLGADLPATRPGCGSMSVDPDRVDVLRAAFTDSPVISRHIEFSSAEDEFEAMYARGWTDGLPVIPPTRERVLRMLTGTTRHPQDIVAIAPPDLVELTVEKIAINAVMAGCLPEYMPWVIAALEAVCNDQFNMHGVLATCSATHHSQCWWWTSWRSRPSNAWQPRQDFILFCRRRRGLTIHIARNRTRSTCRSKCRHCFCW